MRRREFITLLGGAAAWPLAARAQQPERMRRIGVLMNTAADDPASPVRLASFLHGMQQLGWTDGRNVHIYARWGADDADRSRKIRNGIACARAGRHPVLRQPCGGTIAPGDARCAHRIRVGSRPGRQRLCRELGASGWQRHRFSSFEYCISGKWLELLKEIAPRTTRVAVLRDPALASGGGQLGAIQSVAPSFGVEISPVHVRKSGEIERAITAFTRQPNGGLIVTGSALATSHRAMIIALAA